MYCQECGKEAQTGEAICSACGGALSDAELDLPEVTAFPVSAPPEAEEAPEELELATPARMPTAPPAREGAPSAEPGGATGARTQPESGPRLEITVGNLTGSQSLAREVTTIGRADPASGHQPDVDLSMDTAVSRRHAEIRRAQGGYRIIDLGSTNGTVVNDKQIPRQQEVPLADGDEMRLGESCKLTVRL